MLYLKIKESGLKFTLPTNWEEVTLKMYLDTLAAVDEADTLAALSGIEAHKFRASVAPELSVYATRMLRFLDTMQSALSLEDVPKKLKLSSGAEVGVPQKLSGQTTYGQKLMIDAGIKDRQRAGMEPDEFNLAPLLLCVYLYPGITGKTLTDVEQVDEVEEEILKLPALTAIRISGFFLSSLVNLINSGEINSIREQAPGSKSYSRLRPGLLKICRYLRSILFSKELQK